MSERPKGAADPDATVMLPTGGTRENVRDDDATVMIPAVRADEDATIMIPVAKADEDATVMLPAPTVDDDATVMISGVRPAEEPDPEATIAIPTPGRRRDAEAPVLAAGPANGSPAAADGVGELGGLNPLVAAANPVLGIAVHLRQALKHPDPSGLLAELNRSMDGFLATARASGVDDKVVTAASVALCSLVDESAGATPWGSTWLKKGLLAGRHAEATPGSTFFDSLDAFLAEADGNREILEFFYVCLALGFEGRYRDAPDGRQALADLQARLAGRLRSLREAGDGELSAHWRGVAAPASRPAGMLGLWVAASATALLLAVLYIAYSASLGGLSDPVARELAQLKMAPVAELARPVPEATPSPGIAQKLSAEIGRGEVAVIDGAGASTIVIRSDRLFPSGSARLEPGIEAVVLRVAEALDQVPGTVVVTGHTDDVPIRTARFPSNWELSNERAASVVKLMGAKFKEPARLRAEGLADSAPAAPNDSAANRARNRRVEINLRSGS